MINIGLIVAGAAGSLTVMWLGRKVFNMSVVRPLNITVTLPDHDPADFASSASATAWSQDYFCNKCKKSISTDECLFKKLCNHCGTRIGYYAHHERLYRKVVQDGKWRKQYRYNDEKYEVV